MLLLLSLGPISMMAAVVVVDSMMRLLRWMRIVSFRVDSVVDHLRFVVAAVGLGIVVYLVYYLILLVFYFIKIVCE